MAVVVWLAIFPLVTIGLGVMPSWMLELPVAARSFALTVVVVPIAVIIVVPRLTRLLHGWLHR